MAKRKDNYDSEEVTKWVIGKKFSEVKLMNILEEIDPLEKIAIFGYKDFEGSMDKSKISKEELDYRKVNAFELLVSNLILIISNTEFSIKDEKDKMQEYLKDLELVEKITSKIYTKIGKSKVRVKPVYYSVLKIVRKIKSKINFPLYKNNLIYITKEEVDVKEQIDEDQEDFVNQP